ncbi:MAG TPA: hypothetical protein VM095_18255 [Pyrinomonadaceae bacterium]|nr:hypothetical protein [Pyrinomonadaceae bacterium]
MPIKGKEALACILLSVALMSGCKSSKDADTGLRDQSADANSSTAKSTASPTKPDADGVISSGTGEEKEPPAAGKGNVQGKVFYNQKPVAGIEVKLCETFSRYMSGCGGETFVTKTDSNGEYLIKNVPPRIYEGLIVKVFDTNYYVFATSGIVQTAKYRIEADKTFFAPDTQLFKQDLKLLTPKAGSKIGGSNIEVKWDAYPDAAYYKFSIHADSSTGAKTEYDYINKRVDGLSYVLDKPLSPGSYSCKVEAYNSNDIELSESSDDIKFTVTGEAAK